MLTIKEVNRQMIESEIKVALAKETYKSIDDLRIANPTLTVFCHNHKLNYLMRSFSTQFTNDDYINLLNSLQNNLSKEKVDSDTLKQTNITSNNQEKVFIKFDDTQNKNTLAGYDDIIQAGSKEETFKMEKKFEKQQASFIRLTDIDRRKLNKQQMEIYLTIANEPDFQNYEIFFDEFGNMTNIIRKNEDKFAMEVINGQIQFVKQENTKEISNNKSPNEKVKVLESKNNNKISAAFVNTLILSFIVGSFFGIIFLAIYNQVMH